MTDLVGRRLHSQRLTGSLCASPTDVVDWMLAVQSQDFGGAGWGLAQRTDDTTETEFGRLFDEGTILRTHVMRPTWHFVLPADIRWLLTLTGPRVRAGLASRWRQLEIDDSGIDRAKALVTAALSEGRSLTRPQLGKVLEAGGIVTEGQRLPHLLLAAELDGLIVSGPRCGREHTYALLEERAPNARTLDGEEALVELTLRYFRGHGPAQSRDLVWWCGLSAGDVRRGIALAETALRREVVDGVDYWSTADVGPVPDATALAHFLPNFDEYTVGYRDRTAVMDPSRPFDPTLFAFGSILSNIVTVGGKLRGAWRRTKTRIAIGVEVRLLAPLVPAEADAVTSAADRLARYVGRPVEVTGLQS